MRFPPVLLGRNVTFIASPTVQERESTQGANTEGTEKSTVTSSGCGGHRTPITWVQLVSTYSNQLARNQFVEVEKIQKQECITKLEELMSRYPKLWREMLGVARGIKVALTLKEGAQQPVFMRTRPIPYSLRDKVEAEFKKLEKDGVISPVTCSKWATPVVVTCTQARWRHSVM